MPIVLEKGGPIPGIIMLIIAGCGAWSLWGPIWSWPATFLLVRALACPPRAAPAPAHSRLCFSARQSGARGTWLVSLVSAAIQLGCCLGTLKGWLTRSNHVHFCHLIVGSCT